MNSTKTLLRGDKDHPYHLSIGQVILKDNKVALIKKKDGFTSLPRETTYLEESFLESIKRGALEEVGVVVEPVKYLSSLITNFNRDSNTVIEKTTIYFLTKVKEGRKKDPSGDELDDVVLWEDIGKAIEILEKQNNSESRIVKLVENV